MYLRRPSNLYAGYQINMYECHVYQRLYWTKQWCGNYRGEFLQVHIACDWSQSSIYVYPKCFIVAITIQGINIQVEAVLQQWRKRLCIGLK